LIVKDATTDKEIDINEIDTSFYVLTVDLWNAEGTSEVNLVRHSANSPSISTATSSSYPPPQESNISPTYPPFGQHGYPQQSLAYHQQVPGYYGQSNMYQNAYAATAPPPQGGPYYGGGYYQGGMQPNLSPQSAAPGGMFTRNLIGSLSASAFRLTDPDNKIGVWFILQDLSVRTEGTFRYVPFLVLN
jgi:hypothetical protein